MDEEARKRKLQFRYRRDIGENSNIASLPPGLIEAAAKALKEKKPEPLKLKGTKNSHVEIYPSDDSPGMTLKREDAELNALIDKLIMEGFSDDEIVALIKKNSSDVNEGAIADAIKNTLLGAINGVQHHHAKKEKDKVLGKKASPFGRVEPTFGKTKPDSLSINPEKDAPGKQVDDTNKTTAFHKGPPLRGGEDPPVSKGLSNDTIAKLRNTGKDIDTSSLSKDVASKFTKKAEPEPKSEPASTLTLDPNAQKADELRRKTATQTHTNYISALRNAASTNNPDSEKEYKDMAAAHAAKMKQHDVHVNMDDDLAKLVKARKAKLRQPTGKPPPASA